MDELVYQGSSVSELLHDVRQDVEDFELSAAAEKVGALMLHIDSGQGDGWGADGQGRL